MKKLLIIICTFVLAACSKSGDITGEAATATGKNGSITRFIIKDNFMYAIDINYLRVFDISNNDNPTLVKSIEVAYGLETLFIYGNYIYLGAVDGVYVIDINDPTHPYQLQKIQHHISCDPVVVQNNVAYSTQRINATGCGQSWNTSALAVYDVTQPNFSNLVTSITMNQPYGLAAEGNWLYVCDAGAGGIVVFDISIPTNPIRKTTALLSEPRDIILTYPYMLVATKTDFQLYNYADPLNIYHVSTFPLS